MGMGRAKAVSEKVIGTPPDPFDSDEDFEDDDFWDFVT
jgi:hypothetical protein